DEKRARGARAMYVSRCANEVLDALLGIDVRNRADHERVVGQAEPPARLGPAGRRDAKALRVDGWVVHVHRHAQPRAAPVLGDQALAGEHHGIREAPHHGHREVAEPLRRAAVEDLPDHGDAGPPRGQGPLDVDEPAQDDEVDVPVAHDAFDVLDLATEGEREPDVLARVERRPQPVQGKLHDVDAGGAESLGRVPGLVGQGHDRVPPARGERGLEPQRLILRPAVDRVVDDEEKAAADVGPGHDHWGILASRRATVAVRRLRGAVAATWKVSQSGSTMKAALSIVSTGLSRSAITRNGTKSEKSRRTGVLVAPKRQKYS